MRNETRALYNQYIARIALLNAIDIADAVAKTFSATPAVEQALYAKVQESSEFLKRINMPIVRDLAGEIIGLGITGTIAGRTNTTVNDRLGNDPTDTEPRAYQCKSTEFDVAIPWAKLDLWSKFPSFQTLWANLVAARIALDMIMIGWHGTSAAAQTDRVANPLLQDVNFGWLYKMRNENAARVMDDGAVVGKVTYGDTSADYATLDAMVYDARNSLLPTWTKNAPGLVAICNSSLLHDKYFPLINQDADPSEMLARDIIMSTKRLGGLQAAEVPHFPDGKILITTFDNLSIYIQEQSTRRLVSENHKRKRVEDFNSANHAYVIEDLELACLIENIEQYEEA